MASSNDPPPSAQSVDNPPISAAPEDRSPSDAEIDDAPPPLVHERHPVYPDLYARIDSPNRKNKPGMSTIWVSKRHPNVPAHCADHGRHLVLIWPGDPGFLRRVHDRAIKEQAPHWSESLKDLGKS